jgi:DHA2 family multidrug resistance protein
VFRLMAWIFVGALVMVPFCKQSKSAGPAPVDAH